ncbi:MAG: DNA gyrase inhibitor YacG [Planctomycetota bacterium]
MQSYECPICRKTVAVERKEDAPFRPFCSPRCKLVDLGRWLDGTYSVSEPAAPSDLEDLGGDEGVAPD